MDQQKKGISYFSVIQKFCQDMEKCYKVVYCLSIKPIPLDNKVS